MHSLVSLTGVFSVDKLKKIVSQVEVILNQPRFEVHKVYADKNPQFSYRHVFVSAIGEGNNASEYHAMDIGYVKDEPGATSIGDRIYSEEEVEELGK